MLVMCNHYLLEGVGSFAVVRLAPPGTQMAAPGTS